MGQSIVEAGGGVIMITVFTAVFALSALVFMFARRAGLVSESLHFSRRTLDLSLVCLCTLLVLLIARIALLTSDQNHVLAELWPDILYAGDLLISASIVIILRRESRAQ